MNIRIPRHISFSRTSVCPGPFFFRFCKVATGVLAEIMRVHVPQEECDRSVISAPTPIDGSAPYWCTSPWSFGDTMPLSQAELLDLVELHFATRPPTRPSANTTLGMESHAQSSLVCPSLTRDWMQRTGASWARPFRSRIRCRSQTTEAKTARTSRVRSYSTSCAQGRGRGVLGKRHRCLCLFRTVMKSKTKAVERGFKI